MKKIERVEKNIQKDLRKAFPGTNFETESFVYENSGSIVVQWMDFPIVDEVYKVIKQHEQEGISVFTRQDLSMELQKEVRAAIPFEKFSPLQYAYWERQLLNEWYEKKMNREKVLS